MDNTIRHCGMLVAEIAAQRAGKTLDFKDWDGDDSGKPCARNFRKLIMQCDVDADLSVLDEDDFPSVVPEIPTPGIAQAEKSDPKRSIITVTSEGYDSDDSITGYNSVPSSRSNSPTPSELDEIEKDPSLNVGQKKVQKPVYLAQLGAMIRSMGGMPKDNVAEDVDRIEMALNSAEELIRKKKDYGTELGLRLVNITVAVY